MAGFGTGFGHALLRRRTLRVRWALPLAGIVIALWLALAPGTPAAPAFVHAPVAYGCGLGQTPTMLANKIAAMLNPGSQSSSATAPILGIFGPTFLANQAITFDEDLSNMPPSTPPKSQIPIQWNFGDGTQANGFGIQHTFAKAGTYNIIATLPGDPEPFDSAQIIVLAAPFANPPVAVLHASATAVAAGDKVTFDASGSHAVVGSNLTYSWNFADGDTATGPHVTHTFAALTGSLAAKSFVSLIVTDSRGARAVATSPIVVVQQLPKAQLTASSTTLATAETVTFDASGSSAPDVPPNDQLTDYVWNFGDGTPSVQTSSPTTTHSYHKAGHYTATVQAYDQQGAYGTATVSLSVEAFSVGSTGAPWPIFGGALAAIVLLTGGWFFLQAQRKRAAMVRQAMAAQELARARRLNGPPPHRQPAIPAHRRPPQGASGPYPPRRVPPVPPGPPPEYGGRPPYREPSSPYGPSAPRGPQAPPYGHGNAPPPSTRRPHRDDDDWG